jgi:hypothetical protein
VAALYRCSAGSDDRRHLLGIRLRPPWEYDDDPLNDYAHLLNTRAILHSIRKALTLAHVVRPEFQDDGYYRFTLDDSRYDPDHTRRTIYENAAVAPPLDPHAEPLPAGPRPARSPTRSEAPSITGAIPARCSRSCGRSVRGPDCSHGCRSSDCRRAVRFTKSREPPRPARISLPGLSARPYATCARIAPAHASKSDARLRPRRSSPHRRGC